MRIPPTRRFTTFFLAGILVMAATFTTAGEAPPANPAAEMAALAAYRSPYAFAAAVTDPALTPDFREGVKDPANYRQWSPTPFEDWTNFDAVQRLHSTWGPVYRAFQAPQGAPEKPAEWAQLRILAAANQVRQKVPYAHHHMHVWRVPDEPRWRDAHYAPGVGFDCSDFTHWAYSYGLGIQLRTGIGEQAETQLAPMHLHDGQVAQLAAQRVADVRNGFPQNDYARLAATLQPGDLLFIRGDPGLENKITHVILWLGAYASDSNGKDAHLIMDSHGGEVVDSNGNKIPSGPQIRPFREDSWYFRAYDHALRFVPLRRDGAAPPAVGEPRRERERPSN